MQQCAESACSLSFNPIRPDFLGKFKNQVNTQLTSIHQNVVLLLTLRVKCSPTIAVMRDTFATAACVFSDHLVGSRITRRLAGMIPRPATE